MKAIVRTTINFQNDRYSKILIQLSDSNMDMKSLIKAVLKKKVDKIKTELPENGPKKYQSPSDEWKTVHFDMTIIEYDIFQDMMIHTKCTFSLLVALALDEFAYEVLNSIKQVFYHYAAYVINWNNDLDNPTIVKSWFLPRDQIDISFPILE
jgi:hypothetical protein